MTTAPSPARSVQSARLANLAPYREAVRRYFLRRVKNPDDAEDLTHDLFLRITGQGAHEDGEVPQGLIFAAAANLLKDRARRARVASAYQDNTSAVAGDNVDRLTPDLIAEGRQQLNQTLAILNGLEPRVRDVFILHRLEGLRYAEIARLYGLSVSSVEKYMMKAIAGIARHADRSRR